MSWYFKLIDQMCHIFYGSGVFSQANPQKLSSALQHGPSARPDSTRATMEPHNAPRLRGTISSFSSFLSRCHLWKYAELTGFCQEHTWFTYLNVWYFWKMFPTKASSINWMGQLPSLPCASKLTLKPLVLVAMASDRELKGWSNCRCNWMNRMDMGWQNDLRWWTFCKFAKSKKMNHNLWLTLDKLLLKCLLRKRKPCSRNDGQNHEGYTQWVEVEKADIDVWTLRLNWWYVHPNYS